MICYFPKIHQYSPINDRKSTTRDCFYLVCTTRDSLSITLDELRVKISTFLACVLSMLKSHAVIAIAGHGVNFESQNLKRSFVWVMHKLVDIFKIFACFLMSILHQDVVTYAKRISPSLSLIKTFACAYSQKLRTFNSEKRYLLYVLASFNGISLES